MSYYHDDNDPSFMYQAMAARGLGGARPRRFDEYYRTYPIVMMPGPERASANHGGKIFLPASALDKLTTLHITYPMLFELTNGAKGTASHAGVLEFTAEEGRCYLPFWLMQVLGLEPGDLVQVKSTDLPAGSFVKLQPQHVNFLEISDPKAVLETAFRNFACLTVGDVFTFAYNDTVYEIAVLELRPDRAATHAISVQETDLSVDFAPPVGYVEPARASGSSTPRSIASTMAGKGGVLHADVSMAQAINYASIKPGADAPLQGARNAASNFATAGHRLVAKKAKSGAAIPVQNAAAPVAGTSANAGAAARAQRVRAGPQPLRLPPGKLFFGYEVTPYRSKEAKEQDVEEGGRKAHFSGQGQTLRKKK